MLFVLSLTGVSLLGEDFEDEFPPEGWERTGSVWVAGDDDLRSPPGDGRFAVADSRDGSVVDTLLSPAVPSPYSPEWLSLSFAFKFVKFPGGSDTAEVLLREFSGGVWGPWILLRRYDSSAVGIDSLSFTSAAESLQVAFVYRSDDAALFFSVDEVRLDAMVRFGTDAEASEILVPYPIFADSMFRVGYRVRNAGEDSATIYATYEVVSLSSASDTVSLPPGADTVLYLETVAMLPGYLTARLSVSTPGDTYPHNDTIQTSIRVYPSPSPVISAPVGAPRLIDGVLSDSSWSLAGKVEASNWLGGIPTAACSLFVLHDGDAVYLALKTFYDIYLSYGDQLTFALDDDGDGVWDDGEGFNVLYEGGWFSYPPDSTPSLRPDMGASFSFHYDGSAIYKVQVEWAVPKDSLRDPASLNLTGESFGLALSYYDYESGKVVCLWPQTANLSDPATFGKVYLHPLALASRERTGEDTPPFTLEGRTITLRWGALYDAAGRLVAKGGRIHLRAGIYFWVGRGSSRKVLVF
ncbi:MAG: hypothetical protein GXO29_00320 [Thermotogae bacterium]|nr:hypothetical protein [Thermotogota bacterium]